MQYLGGKNVVYHRIVNQIPPHRVYVELFAGSAPVLRKKRPAAESWAIELDPGAIARLNVEVLPPATTVLQMDAFEFLAKTSMAVAADWFLYVDPPYLASTRRGGRLYAHELTREQHCDLLCRLCKSPAMVMVSGYDSWLYRTMLRGWRSYHFPAMTRQGWSEEWLWMNYAEPAELHDYRHLGDNFRERERIRRQQRRWAAKLARMDRLQRYALLAAIAGDRNGRNGEQSSLEH
jgi:hypothetical protein